MLPDQVSNPGPLTYESDALPIALRGPVKVILRSTSKECCRYNVQIIVVTAKMQISLRVLSVELQASFLYYVRGGCRHSALLSSVQIENLWICGQSPPFTQTIFGS